MSPFALIITVVSFWLGFLLGLKGRAPHSCFFRGHQWRHAGNGYTYSWFRCRRCGQLEAL